MTPINSRPEPKFELSLGQTTDTLQPLCGTFDAVWTRERMPEFLGKTFRAKAYQDQYVTCVGLEAHFVNLTESEDNGMTHKGSYRQHWQMKRYVRKATPEEITERQSRP